MKQLTCEMCGSTDLLKQDGVFVCQSCGCKYSVEEAKKLMIEGTVDVSGSTVKVDSTDKLNNLYTLARRAKENNDSAKAQRYYEEIALQNPDSWEAVFYSVYYKTMNCRVGEIQNAARLLAKSLDSVVELVHKNIADSKEKKQIINEICLRCIQITKLLTQAEMNHWTNMSSDMLLKYTAQMASVCFSCSCILYHLGDCIHSKFSGIIELCEFALYAWDAGRIYHSPTIKYSDKPEKEKGVYENYGKKIDKLKDEISVKKEEIKNERIKLYWEQHKKEKERLDTRKRLLEEEISKYNADISHISGADEIKGIEENIKRLTSEKSTLGLFKMKEKKALQEKIDAETLALMKVEDRVKTAKSEIQKKILPLQERINAIKEELTRDR